jgi:RND family efflux transporter MFP subunit
MNRIVRLIVVVLALTALVAVAVFVSKGRTNAVAVKTITLKRTAFVSKLPENGVVQRPHVATIPTLVGGNIGGIFARAGDRVTAGELLATIENPTLQSDAAGSQADYDSAAANVRTARIDEQNARVGYVAAVETAKSNLAEAQRIYRADVNLYANQAIPKTQLDADKAKLDQMQVQYDQAVRQLQLGAVTGYGVNSVQYAQAAAEKARIVNDSNQQQLSFTRITAPFDGVIQTVAVQTDDPLTSIRPGDPVTAGQALFTIASSETFIVKAEVDEQDVINVHRGQRAEITGEDFPGKTILGHVTDVSPVAIKSSDPSSTARQVLTTIALDRMPGFLRDGMSVDVDILTADVPRSLVVPTSALNADGKKNYVYVVRAGKAVKTYVRTGAANDTQTVVLWGLDPGEVVVAEKNPLVHDGAAVKPQPMPSAMPAV